MSGGVKSKKKLVLVVISAVVFVLLAGGATWYFAVRASNHSPFSKQIKNNVSFPLYYPSALPTGYALDKKSVGSDGMAVHYTLVNPSKKLIITITMQATPAGFDAAKIIGKTSIPNSIMPSGTLYNISLGDSSKYMFTTGDGTLLFITAITDIPTSDINIISKNLEKIKA